MTRITLFQHATKTCRYTAGTVIFHEGEPSTAIYIVREGEIDLSYRKRALATIGPGKLIGIAFVSKQCHVATATARTDCTLIPIDERQWSFLVQQTPHFAVDVMAILVEQLHEFIELHVRPPVLAAHAVPPSDL